MSTQPQQSDGSSTDTTENEENDILADQVTRRRAMQMGAAAIAAGAGAGSAAAQQTEEDDLNGEVTLDFEAELAHSGFVDASYTVVSHEADMGDLGYVNDSNEPVSLADHGFRLRTADDGNAINPVKIRAKDIKTTEYTAFPRGVQYDSDGDGTDDTDVRAVDQTHWSTDASGSTGSISVTNGDHDSLVVDVTGQAAGDVAIARFTDFSITDGMSRKWLQLVQDFSFDSGAIVEFRIEDSTGAQVVAKNDPNGDASTHGVLTSQAGVSQVTEARVGELEQAQSTTLDDIVALEIAVLDSNATMTLNGINLDKSERWTFGKQEFINSDSEVDTRVVTEPAGKFGVMTIDDDQRDDVFTGEAIDGKDLLLEQHAEDMASGSIWARVKDTPDTYDEPKELEWYFEFQGPSAYDLEGGSYDGSLWEIAEFPPGRYVSLAAASGYTQPDTWEDVNNISWTERSNNLSSTDQQVEMLPSPTITDYNGEHGRVVMSRERVRALTKNTGGAAVAVDNSGGDESGFAYLITLVTGSAVGLGVLFRKNIMGLLSGS